MIIMADNIGHICYILRQLPPVRKIKKVQRTVVLMEQASSEDTKRDAPPPFLNK